MPTDIALPFPTCTKHVRTLFQNLDMKLYNCTVISQLHSSEIQQVTCEKAQVKEGREIFEDFNMEGYGVVYKFCIFILFFIK